jgi:pyridoxine 5'-phosphate synthase PdxJ
MKKGNYILILGAIIFNCLISSCNNNKNNNEAITENKENFEDEENLKRINERIKDSLEEVRNRIVKDSLAVIEKKQEAKKRKASTYNAREFLEMIGPYYGKNVVTADAKFQGKVYYIKGEVADISKNFSGDIYFNIGMGHPYQNIQCFVDNKSEIENISVGQNVTAKCIFQSLFAAGQVNVNITMEHCEIVND